MMTPLKMWCLRPLAVLLLLSITPTETKVVNEMSECAGFLLGETPPQVPCILENGQIIDENRYKIICQTYENKERFVTLYDTKNKIPVFSAYKYKGGEGEKADCFWKIEPQLENMTNDVNMEDCDTRTEYTNQASYNDYSGTYTKGHLFPFSYVVTRDDRMSTCTLTNAVPQVDSFNEGSWARMESCVKCILDKFCNDKKERYLVTGAEPSPNKNINDRVNVPSVLWSAFCCYSENLNNWIASAYWGENVPEEPKVKHVQTRTLQELHDKLSISNKKFEAFPKTQCPLKETVAFYPQIDKNCPCTVHVPGTEGEGRGRGVGGARGVE
ncbi:endonuclease domain-containing 1 protein-like [Anabas testudineus]|uniref:Uncharacterized protein n=1 Tax=Anabas testudineus TaxID=64144 RepID=A0A3Q1IKB6_ANATE|nr:endonuclease domain-containing 1 protein-like [Anabas testudineus]